MGSLLRRRCRLGADTRGFEIGGGTGIATRQILELGVGHLTVIEPDVRLVRFLRASLEGHRPDVEIVRASFEATRLPPGEFDFGFGATSFHWLNEISALRKVARWLRPGGWWAAWWNVVGDPRWPTPFQRALAPLYAALPSSPSAGRAGRPPFALDRVRRLSALRATDRFERITVDVFRWNWRLSTPRLRALFGTFSEVTTLPSSGRKRFLDALGAVAEEQFDGIVSLPMITPVYTARRA